MTRVARLISSQSMSATVSMLAMATCLQARAEGTPAALAGGGDVGGLAEVVVTAEKTEGSLQKTPLAITALSSEDLSKSNITDIQALGAHVPGFNFGESFGVAKFSLRGVSFSNLAVGADPSVAYNLNGIYVSRPAGQLGNFYDIQGVEVLRGPQGTLYGRNATAGAVNITTAQPTDNFSGYATAGYGNYNDLNAEGAISGPVGGGILARLAVHGERRDGFGKNLLTGQKIDDLKTYGARLSLKCGSSSSFSALVVADFDYENDRSYGLHLLAKGGLTNEVGSPGIDLAGLGLGGQTIINSRDTLNDYVPGYDRKQYGISADLKWSLGSLDLRSISGYRHLTWNVGTDLDGTSFPLTFLTEGETSKQFSQEFNVSQSGNWGKWTLGAYYFHEDMDGGIVLPQNFDALLPPGQYFKFYFGGGSIKTDAYAAYGQTSIKLSSPLSLTVGARYSRERKSEVDLYTDFINSFDYFTPYVPGQPPIAAPFAQSATFSSFTPKIGLEYQMNPDTLIYLSWSKGFKAGGFNLGGAYTLPGQPNNPINPPVQPETLKAFEAGVKAMFFERRLRANLAAFSYKYTNLQVSQVTALVILLENAAAARIYGAEAEITALPTDNLELGLSGSWLHARFSEFSSINPNICPGGFDASQLSNGLYPCLDNAQNLQNLKGNALPQAPDFTITASAQYTIPMGDNSLVLRGEANWVDTTYFDEFNRDVLSQQRYAKVNAFVTWSNKAMGWDIRGYVTNALDKKTVATAYESGFGRGYPVFGVYAPPRQFGVLFTKHF